MERVLETAPAPRSHEVNPWLVLVLVCLAQFMVILDATIVNVALPSIQEDLQFSAADLQWVINSYTLVFGGFLLLGGRAADLAGAAGCSSPGSSSSRSRRC
jgi:MFS family permease